MARPDNESNGIPLLLPGGAPEIVPKGTGSSAIFDANNLRQRMSVARHCTARKQPRPLEIFQPSPFI